MHGLDEHRIADPLGHLRRIRSVCEDSVTAWHDGNPETTRGTNRVRLVAHGFHRIDRRADEVDAVRAAEFRKVCRFGKEANAGVQGIHAFELSDPDHGKAVEIALIGRVTTDAHQAIIRAEHVGRNRFHVRVGLYKHHIYALALGDAYELGCSTATRMNERALHRADEALRRNRNGRSGHLRGFTGNDPGHYPLNHFAHGFARNRNVRIDGAKRIVEATLERMPDEPLHGSRRLRKVVRER